MGCFYRSFKAIVYFILLLLLVGAYCALGAFVFAKLEWKPPVPAPNITSLVLNVSTTYNISYNTSKAILRNMEETLKQQLDSKDIEWTLLNSAAFCLTVLTTIGYGVIAPKTPLGRLFCIMYSIIGIPLCLVMLSYAGTLMNNMSTWLVRSFEQRVLRRQSEPKYLHVKILLITSTVTAIATTVTFGPFQSSTGWTTIDCLYFLWISTSTIGFGDLYPTADKMDFVSSWEKQLKGDFSDLTSSWRDKLTGIGIICYIIFSLAMVASIFSGIVELISEMKDLMCGCCKCNRRGNAVISIEGEETIAMEDIK